MSHSSATRNTDTNPSSLYLAMKDTANYYQLLFPYLELKNGPKVTPLELDNTFFTCPDSLKSNPVYQAWAQAKTEGDRSKVQADAVSYINSEQFIRYPQQLLSPLIGLLDEDFTGLQSAEDLIHLIEKHFASLEAFADALHTPDYQANLAQLWLSTFSLIIILDYEIHWLDQMLYLLTKLNVLDKALKQVPLGIPWSDFFYTMWLNADLILPSAIFPLPRSVSVPSSAPDHDMSTSIRPYSIGTLHRVEYTLIGYELGELQKVESVLQGELRESQLDLTISSTTDQVSSQAKQDHDESLSTLKEQDLLAQVQQTLENKTTVNTLDKYATQYIATSANASTSGSWTIDENPMGGGNQQTADFIKDVLAKTEQRVSRNVSQVKQVRLSYEQASRERQRFQNDHQKHINGFYYWLNKRYRVQALESQKRMMIEINLNFKQSELHRQLKNLIALEQTAPISLSEKGITHYSTILLEPTVAAETEASQQTQAESNPAFYLNLYQAYNIEQTIPAPQLQRSINVAIRSELVTASRTIQITKGYTVKTLTMAALVGDAVASLAVLVAGKVHSMTLTQGQANLVLDMSEVIEESIEVSFHTTFNPKSNACTNNISVNCSKDKTLSGCDQSQIYSLNLALVLTQETLSQWQFCVYEACQQAYQQQLLVYRASVKALKETLASQDNKVTLNLINRELVKMSIESLFEHSMVFVKGVSGEPRDLLAYQQYFDYSLEWEHLYCKLINEVVSEKGEASGTPEKDDLTSLNKNSVNKLGTETLDTNKIQTLPVLSELDSTLYLYRFLSAKHAKLLVPVKQGYEKRFIYFYETGRIWHGKEALTPVNQDALALINDYKRLVQHDKTERLIDEWQVCLPTVMSVVDNNDALHHIGEHLDKA